MKNNILKSVLKSVLVMGLLVGQAFAWEAARIKDVGFEKISDVSGRLIIKYEGTLQGTPDLSLGQNILQISLEGAKISGRMDKELNIGGENFDSTIVAFQDDKDHVKVKLTVPFKTSDLEQKSSVTVKEKEIILDFPLRGVVPAKAKKNANKDSGYDENFLNKLLSDKEIKAVKNPQQQGVIKTSPKLEELEKKLLDGDEVKNTFSAAGKESVPFKNVSNSERSAPSPLRYAGKFGIFLVLVLGLFFAVVHFFKKGVFSRGKLGFLNSTPLITTLSTTYIGPKRSLMLVKVNNQVFFLGCSEGGINILSEIEGVPGLLKEGEKSLTGKNFDTDMTQMDALANLEEKIKIKDNIELSEVSNHSLKKIKNVPQDKVKFSEELKKKVKGLRPMQ